jgi:hypothetical protein
MDVESIFTKWKFSRILKISIMVGHPIFKVPSLLTVYVQMEQSSNNIPVI